MHTLKQKQEQLEESMQTLHKFNLNTLNKGTTLQALTYPWCY